MSHTPSVTPEPGTRPALSAADLLVFACELFAFATFAFWGFAAWPFPWNIVMGIGTPVVGILLWALFVSPRAVLHVHPYVRAVIELLVFAGATIALWSMGLTWIGLVFALVAIVSGVVAGRKRFA
ncbi:MAG: YrdB family protein [Microbacterium sp.]|uniref:YrdB family protein n=1 Tax=Microbacterium sp. TaxID=51671 RepID=UPI000926AE96|nr:YrdB family protein [Microbacterium sp.]OJU63826.1 MAG: 4-amino-4-deoxy-L-arabinose transferase [Microbacterium sp. 70-38]MBN9154858.1 YrdB family protein [Microbacterium sp.]MBN9170447.1 YrdB family protein [Microbacterium sp.]MBN9174348.1 YrdB family protein [Microbacterium sp.]MBN9179971.1 YrdB family protein [Microbacterium sp.]